MRTLKAQFSNTINQSWNRQVKGEKHLAVYRDIATHKE
ncbi:hypothetical protein ANRL1_00931 [Anaerolineae bacterium]|nr:hypothetical protein ANRL1_00931 [Anaerolineae bacterium]